MYFCVGYFCADALPTIASAASVTARTMSARMHLAMTPPFRGHQVLKLPSRHYCKRTRDVQSRGRAGRRGPAPEPTATAGDSPSRGP